jgi:O-antigen biosynthesis protein
MDFRRVASIDQIRVPVRCVDVELTEPVCGIVEPGYQSAHILVRLRGEPVGAITLRLMEGRCSPSTIANAIIERLARSLVRVAVRQAIDYPLDVFPLDAYRLAELPVAEDDPLPSVTVVVCTRGRSDILPSCLDAISQLDHPDVEAIVVDNSAERDVVEGIVNARSDARYLHEPGSGLDRARNRAIVAATRDIVAFTDDDVLIDPGWARAIARRFGSSPEASAVTGLVMPLELDTEPQLMFEQYLGFGRGFERRWIEDVDPTPRPIALRYGNTGRLGTGANMAFRRSVLATIGGFDPALDLGTVTNGGGDLDMFFRVIKAGGVLVYEPSALVRHRHRRDWHELEEQLGDWGTAMRSYVERNRLTYPEERLRFAMLVSWLLGTWHLRRLARSVVDPHLSTRLVLDEMRGLIGGRTRYDRAQEIADDVARQFGASIPRPRAARRVGRRGRRPSHAVVEHAIDLAAPIAPFTPGDQTASIRLRITYEGYPVATATFAHRGHTVSAPHLRDVAARAVSGSMVTVPAGVRRGDASERELAAGVIAVLQSAAEESPRHSGRSNGERRARAGVRRR